MSIRNNKNKIYLNIYKSFDDIEYKEDESDLSVDSIFIDL